MPANLEPIGFWSYTSQDDKLADGRLSQLRVLLARALQQRMGRQKVHVFQDVAAIPHGADWHDKIHDALAQSSFLIPIITPGFLGSEMCCEEVMRFREREKELGRKDLIFPFRYIDVSDIGPDECHTPEVMALLKSRQWIEFENLRYRDPRTEEVMKVLDALARSIRAALRTPAVARDERPSEQPKQADATPSQTPIDGATEKRAEVSRSETVRRVSMLVQDQPATVPAGPALPPKPAWAAAIGTDPFGTWADIVVPAKSGLAVTQRLRLIPAGEFSMGSPDNEPGRYPDEGPCHQVTIELGFWLFDTPCTQALWQAVMDDNPSRFQSPTRPVETVSFEGAKRFVAEVNKRAPGLYLALPSEARWEYACRGGINAATYAGPIKLLGERHAPILDKIAWYGGNSGIGFELTNGHDSSDWPEKQYPHLRAGTHPVKGKDPNPWGLHDMLGNVWEWCEDPWHDGYVKAPRFGSPWLDRSAAGRVVRGGSWNGGARFLRAAARYAHDIGYRYDDLGFRCARVLD